MQEFNPTRRERIDALALFAAIAFAVGVGAIAALERVGAPDGLVEAMGPMFAFVGLSVVGLANRAVNLTDFLAARRVGPNFYGALAFVAIVSGVALARAAAVGHADAVAWTPIGVGAGFGALALAPALRGAQVSAGIDALATRFPAKPVRIAFSFVTIAVGLLTAFAGFSLAAQSLAAEFEANRALGVAFAVAGLAFTLPPGGARSAFWTDAASGGGALLIVAVGAALAMLQLPAPLAPLGAGLARLADDVAAAGATPASSLALGVALAFFAPLAQPALAARSARAALRMGAGGVVLALVALAAAAVALPLVATIAANGVHTAKALLAAATWLPTLALARSGVWLAARAVGLDMTGAFTKLSVLSSRRIALSRLATLATIAICPLAMKYLGLAPGAALTLALSLTLALLAPSLALALRLRGRGSSMVAGAALMAAVMTMALRAKLAPFALDDNLLVGALAAGVIGLVVGALVALVYPDRAKVARLPVSDAFAETPFDRLD